ncbi:MAG: tripartite tricarboxylate transporter substrate binding protein [Eubacteriales bacterium]|nr:tripartite tricarboxylate transporter substrate binding protein [Eubacteriales bacterium]
MKKFALVLAAAMGLTLAACSGSQQAAPAATTAAAETTAAATEAAKQEAAAETTAAEAAAGLDFPTETITLICPFSAGGGTDVGARFLAESLSKVVGQNVVVENVTGAGGWNAWTDLIQGDYSDGYTIGLVNHNYAMGELDPENPREYNLDSIKVLANQALDYNVIALRADDARFSDINSFIEYAKAQPVLISAQATGITDGDATTAEWFNQTFGTQITIVPVDGASDSRSMFLAGDTDVFFASISDVQEAYNNGEMNVVAIFAPERSNFIPDVPTIKEATGEEYFGFAARGYFYPAGVSDDIVEYMTNAILKAEEDPDYIKNMESQGLQLDNTSGEAYKELLSKQKDQRIAIWGN